MEALQSVPVGRTMKRYHWIMMADLQKSDDRLSCTLSVACHVIQG